MHKGILLQFPQISLQKMFYLNNSADAKFCNRITVCAAKFFMLLQCNYYTFFLNLYLTKQVR
jgi:hypothetical protein